MSKKQNKDQLYRVDGNGCFVEVLSGMLQGNKNAGREGRVILNFVKYDKANGNKMQCQIPIYIPVSEFLVLAKKIEFGKIDRLCEAEKQLVQSGEHKYAQDVWKILGGTSKESLRAQNKSRSDGKDESRVMLIMPATRSSSASIVLEAQRGPGEANDQGIIAPKFDYRNRNFESIMVSLSSDALMEMALIVTMHIQGMITAGWMRGQYQYEQGERPNSTQPTAEQQQNMPYDAPASSSAPSTVGRNPVTYQECPVEYDDMPFN